MSRTKSNVPKSKRGGYDYWSRRSKGAPMWGRVGKWITKRQERRENARMQRLAKINPDAVRGRLRGE